MRRTTRIVVADSKTKRDGRVIEEIGKYHPTEEPSFIEVDSERAQYWLSVGAQPTEQVAAILKITGDWGKFKGDADAKSTLKVKEPKAPFEIDASKKSVVKPKAEKKVEAPLRRLPPRPTRRPLRPPPPTQSNPPCSPPRSNTSSRGSSITRKMSASMNPHRREATSSRCACTPMTVDA